MIKHEYVFDVKMVAVFRVRASSEEKARSALSYALDCADLTLKLCDDDADLAVTESSVYADDVLGPCLLAIDGAPVT